MAWSGEPRQEMGVACGVGGGAGRGEPSSTQHLATSSEQWLVRVVTCTATHIDRSAAIITPHE